jgi:hypothetical protein
MNTRYKNTCNILLLLQNRNNTDLEIALFYFDIF